MLALSLLQFSFFFVVNFRVNSLHKDFVEIISGTTDIKCEFWSTYWVRLQLSEAVAQTCSVKKVFLEISQSSIGFLQFYWPKKDFDMQYLTWMKSRLDTTALSRLFNSIVAWMLDTKVKRFTYKSFFQSS